MPGTTGSNTKTIIASLRVVNNQVEAAQTLLSGVQILVDELYEACADMGLESMADRVALLRAELEALADQLGLAIGQLPGIIAKAQAVPTVEGPPGSSGA